MQVKDKKDFTLRFYSLVERAMPDSLKCESVDENSSEYKEFMTDFDRYVEGAIQTLNLVKQHINKVADTEDADFVGDCLSEADTLIKYLNDYLDNK